VHAGTVKTRKKKQASAFSDVGNGGLQLLDVRPGVVTMPDGVDCARIRAVQ
jgi:hypothetical protein